MVLTPAQQVAKFKVKHSENGDGRGIEIDYVIYFPTGAKLLPQDMNGSSRMVEPEEGSLECLKDQQTYWNDRLRTAMNEFVEERKVSDRQIAEQGRMWNESDLAKARDEARRVKAKVDEIQDAIDNHPEIIARAEADAREDAKRERSRKRLNNYTL